MGTIHHHQVPWLHSRFPEADSLGLHGSPRDDFVSSWCKVHFPCYLPRPSCRRSSQLLGSWVCATSLPVFPLLNNPLILLCQTQSCAGWRSHMEQQTQSRLAYLGVGSEILKGNATLFKNSHKLCSCPTTFPSVSVKFVKSVASPYAWMWLTLWSHQNIYTLTLMASEPDFKPLLGARTLWKRSNKVSDFSYEEFKWVYPLLWHPWSRQSHFSQWSSLFCRHFTCTLLLINMCFRIMNQSITTRLLSTCAFLFTGTTRKPLFCQVIYIC